MKRYILLMFSLFFLFNMGISYASDEYSVKHTQDPKLRISIPLSERFTYAFVQIHGDYLWVTGRETIKPKENKPLVAVYDISEPFNPRLISMFNHDDYNFNVSCAKGNYAYYLSYDSKKRTEDEKRKFDLCIMDISDVRNPILIKKIEKMFGQSSLFINGEFLYVFENYTPNIIGTAMRNASTQVHKVDLKDPIDPKIISSTFKYFPMSQELESFDGIVDEVYFRDNLIYVLTNDEILIFKNDDMYLAGRSNFSFSPRSFCLIDDFDKIFYYFLCSGDCPNLQYPDPSINASEQKSINGLFVLSQWRKDIGNSQFDDVYISYTSKVRIPFIVNDVYSIGTMAYVFGHDAYGEIDPYMQVEQTTQHKMMVVDYTKLYNPEFVGSFNFTDQFIHARVFRNNVAYLIGASRQEPRSNQKFTLHVMELPIKEGVFQRSSQSLFDSPYYKQLELTEKGVENLLRKEIGKPVGELKESDFVNLKILDLSHKKLTNLEGIELCTNLEELFLDYNYLKDISPLAKLTKLHTLDLGNNMIEDITPLGSLTNLEDLKLGSIKTSDISALSNLNELEMLDLSYNKIDINQLSKLTNLKELRLRSCGIFDISPLSNLQNLESLDIKYNAIMNIDPITKLNKLQKLVASDNNIRDISPLINLRDLENLNLENNRIEDLSQIIDLPKLEYLNIGRNPIKDYSPISSLKSLKYLEISNTPFSDLSFVEPLINLEELKLYTNNISDISPLSSLTNLKRLMIRNNKVIDIKPLSSLTKIETLTLSYNQITDISALSNCSLINCLDLLKNNIENIEALRSLSKLEKAYLAENQIKDIEPIIGLTKLKNANFYKNTIDDISVLESAKLPVDSVINVDENPVPFVQIDKFRKIFFISPGKNESSAAMNLISIASAEIQYHEDFGEYTKEIQKFVKSGYIYFNRGVEYFTFDDLLVNYNVAVFDISVEGFKIVITPKESDKNLRIFGIDQEGVLFEWLDDNSKFDSSNVNFADKSWKKWPKESQFSMYYPGGGC